MPSWNIHIAQTERLLAGSGACARLVRDGNVFLFGNLMPDIPVGYMVPGVPHVPYRETHFADPVPIPKPHEKVYWNEYVKPAVDDVVAAGGRILASGRSLPALCDLEKHPAVRGSDPTSVPFPDAVTDFSPLADEPDGVVRARFDLTLGVWAHLLADAIWNHRVNEYLDSIGGEPGEEFRIKKQADFDGFGKTLEISSVPRETDVLIAAAETFAQYSLARNHVHDAILVAHEIVRSNGATDHLPYRLLTDEFFERVFEEVVVQTDRLLRERLLGGV